MSKDIEIKCSASTACMSSVKNYKYQLSSTQKINLLVLTEHGQEIQFDFSGKLVSKHVTGESYFFLSELINLLNGL